jgi:hypothetical protein
MKYDVQRTNELYDWRSTAIDYSSWVAKAETAAVTAAVIASVTAAGQQQRWQIIRFSALLNYVDC